MEVRPEKLLAIFKAAYRLGEATRTYKPNPLVVASEAEIEADAIPIIKNMFAVESATEKLRLGVTREAMNRYFNEKEYREDIHAEID